VFLLIAATSSATAQTPVLGAKESSVEGAVVHQTGPKYSDAAFSGSINPHYAGNDLREIYTALEGRAEPKGEFETTLEYQNRLSRAMTMPLAGELRLDSMFAFVIQPGGKFDSGHFYHRYDADKEEMLVSLTPDETYQDDKYKKHDSVHYSVDQIQIESTKAIIWREELISSYSYMASNAFGASTEVTSSHSEVYALLYDTSTSVDEMEKMANDGRVDELVGVKDLRFHLPVPEAKAVGDRLRVLIICSIKEVPVMSGSTYNAPTISKPYQIFIKYKYLHVALDSIWVFDDETGRVYAKQDLHSQQVAPQNQLAAKVHEHADFTCNVIWTMLDNRFRLKQDANIVVDTALVAMKDRAKENKAEVSPEMWQTIRSQLESQLAMTANDKKSAESIRKADATFKEAFVQSCVSQTDKTLRAQVGLE
jgi:hypothetical protein